MFYILEFRTHFAKISIDDFPTTKNVLLIFDRSCLIGLSAVVFMSPSSSISITSFAETENNNPAEELSSSEVARTVLKP